MRNWKRDETEQLINLVERNECIFNVRSFSYLDRNKKAESFNKILNEMKKTDSTLTIKEIKRKWKNLRTQYMQEVRTGKNSKKSGSGVADRPKLWCFKKLSFLKTHTETRGSVDNISGKPSEFKTDEFASCHSFNSNEKENVHSIEELTADENENCLPSGSKSKSFMMVPPKKKQKKSEAVQEFRKDLDVFKNVLAARRIEKKFAGIGALVVEIMEAISPEFQDDAAWQIQCLMRKLKQEAQRNHSSSTSSVKDILELFLEGILDEDDI